MSGACARARVRAFVRARAYGRPPGSLAPRAALAPQLPLPGPSSWDAPTSLPSPSHQRATPGLQPCRQLQHLNLGVQTKCPQPPTHSPLPSTPRQHHCVHPGPRPGAAQARDQGVRPHGADLPGGCPAPMAGWRAAGAQHTACAAGKHKQVPHAAGACLAMRRGAHQPPPHARRAQNPCCACLHLHTLPPRPPPRVPGTPCTPSSQVAHIVGLLAAVGLVLLLYGDISGDL